jgi:hypothetical protein
MNDKINHKTTNKQPTPPPNNSQRQANMNRAPGHSAAVARTIADKQTGLNLSDMTDAELAAEPRLARLDAEWSAAQTALEEAQNVKRIAQKNFKWVTNKEEWREAQEEVTLRGRLVQNAESAWSAERIAVLRRLRRRN